MHLTDEVMLQIAKERADEARSMVALTRTLRCRRVPRPPMRVRLGAALIRLGHRIGGQSLAGTPSALESPL